VTGTAPFLQHFPRITDKFRHTRELAEIHAKANALAERVKAVEAELAETQANASVDAFRVVVLQQELITRTTDRAAAVQLLVADAVAVASELQRRTSVEDDAPMHAHIPADMHGALAAVEAWTTSTSCAITEQVLRDVDAAAAFEERLVMAMEAVRIAVDSRDDEPIDAAVLEERDTAREAFITACRMTTQRARSSVELLDAADRDLKELLCALASASATISATTTVSSPAHTDTHTHAAPTAHVVQSARDALTQWNVKELSEAAKATSTLQGLLGRFFEVCSAAGVAKDSALLVDGLPSACQALDRALQAENDRVAAHRALFPSALVTAALTAMQIDANVQLDNIARVREAAEEFSAKAEYQSVHRPDPAAVKDARKAVRAAKRELDDALHKLEDAIEDEGLHSEAVSVCQARLKAAKKK
jgi:hypothetical protein